MKRLVICICVFVLSCDYFEKKKIKTEDIVSQELQHIDWNAVDSYPTFAMCHTKSEKEENRRCFEQIILGSVNSYLSKQNIIVSEDVDDTIMVKLQINKLGEISVLDINSKPETQRIIPAIDSLLIGSISKLPKIYPAIKRGQQVQTEFVLPVVVSIK
ncbi:hypothetical protein ACFQ1Q_06930 [Winogradskyella litorisediminis]|uniref:TonB-like protein n=1 Tax=Winogradskyella litorisediminis TaxID=1156618 RepID=A0ABW3N8W6_9FLAO